MINFQPCFEGLKTKFNYFDELKNHLEFWETSSTSSFKGNNINFYRLKYLNIICAFIMKEKTVYAVQYSTV